MPLMHFFVCCVPFSFRNLFITKKKKNRPGFSSKQSSFTALREARPAHCSTTWGEDAELQCFLDTKQLCAHGVTHIQIQGSQNTKRSPGQFQMFVLTHWISEENSFDGVLLLWRTHEDCLPTFILVKGSALLIIYSRKCTLIFTDAQPCDCT